MAKEKLTIVPFLTEVYDFPSTNYKKPFNTAVDNHVILT
jgi:hypothetical protein